MKPEIVPREMTHHNVPSISNTTPLSCGCWVGDARRLSLKGAKRFEAGDAIIDKSLSPRRIEVGGVTTVN